MIYSHCSGSRFEKWLKVVQSHSVNNLQYVDIGLGHQSFHAEFVGDNASFTFLIRDERRCKSFLRQFTSKHVYYKIKYYKAVTVQHVKFQRTGADPGFPVGGVWTSDVSAFW